ncbi:MAG: hypothetical protein GWP35_07165 [Proteobacteria bacterium]|nr:hypothetical protein [Pseudomonadota bacterium]
MAQWFSKYLLLFSCLVVLCYTTGLTALGEDEQENPLVVIEPFAVAWNQGKWEESLLRFLELSTEMQTASAHYFDLAGISKSSDVFEVVRNRSWRHIRDLLGAVDKQGGAQEMADLLPRLHRIQLVCTVTGMKPPPNSFQIIEKWKQRSHSRFKSDACFHNLKEALLQHDEKWAAEELASLRQIRLLDVRVQCETEVLLEESQERLQSELLGARQRVNPGSVLEICKRLEWLGKSSKMSHDMAHWARDELRRLASENMSSNREGQALLQLAKLIEEDGTINDVVGSLREKLSLTLRPRIVASETDLDEIPNEIHVLIPGAIEIERAVMDQNQKVTRRFEPVGRKWIRSPDHLADSKIWLDSLEEILLLKNRWLDTPVSESQAIIERLNFHVQSAQRLARRLAANPARRSRSIWELQSREVHGDVVRVKIYCPVALIDDVGREVWTAIECTEFLQPSQYKRVTLPVRISDCEKLEQQLRARIGLEIEKLADRWARGRLEETISKARILAQQGNRGAAMELLLPALIGAEDSDSDLRDIAAADLARWSGLGERAIRAALGRSETP